MMNVRNGEKKRCSNWKKDGDKTYEKVENCENTTEQNNATEQPVTSENNDCSKWKGDCGKWKKYRKNKGENCESNDVKGCDKWIGRKGKWNVQNQIEIISDSESIEDKTAEEITKEIGSLKEEIGLLMEKKKALWQEVVVLKGQIKELRQNNGAKEDIVKLREQIVEKKRGCQEYQMQVANSKGRIWKLKSALEIKAN